MIKEEVLSWNFIWECFLLWFFVVSFLKCLFLEASTIKTIPGAFKSLVLKLCLHFSISTALNPFKILSTSKIEFSFQSNFALILKHVKIILTTRFLHKISFHPLPFNKLNVRNIYMMSILMKDLFSLHFVLSTKPLKITSNSTFTFASLLSMW